MVMKVTRELEVTICDFCQDEISYGLQGEISYGGNPCLRCGKVYCYNCAKTSTVKYMQSVSYSGGGDGTYCIPCDTFLLEHPQPLHTAYLRIANLRVAQQRSYKDFQIAAQVAEAELKAIQDKEVKRNG